MSEKVINVNGMTCNHCVKAVEVELEDIGVTTATVKIGQVIIDSEESKDSLEKIYNAIEEAGYKPQRDK
ncbi:MAG: cation transporter [Melioribacteraceae bacterium]|nr:cation transporter [Melioribacteraceae bacterium]MCF8264895.1 cation transporter [Melioribacteraceae bacterium]MCF8432476.1 cation transporter [Melioribacteraceae bacterium]